MGNRFSYTLTQVGDLCWVKLYGEVDLTTAGEFRQAVRHCHSRLHLDCNELTFLDASGIAVLAEAKAIHGSVEMHNVAPQVRRLLTIVGMEDFLAPERN